MRREKREASGTERVSRGRLGLTLVIAAAAGALAVVAALRGEWLIALVGALLFLANVRDAWGSDRES